MSHTHAQAVEGLAATHGRRARAFLAAVLAALVLASWAYLAWLAAAMDSVPMAAMGPAGVAMTHHPPWTLETAVAQLVMWWVMMIAMMLPSAWPMIALFHTIGRKQRAARQASVPTAVFLGAYLVAWGGFSIAATATQWAFHARGWLSAMGEPTSWTLSGVLFVAAGIYQWTPLKQACLRHCRSPLFFLLQHWRDGAAGAWRLGTRHGIYCLGCCWVLMLLLFAVGVMNLLWVLALTILVLAEKIVPGGQQLARVSGLAMAGLGLYLLAV